MLEAGVRPNASTFPSVVGSCANLLNPQLGEETHAHILRFGCESDPYVASSLVHMYAKCHRIYSARKVLDRMPERSVVSWTCLIQCYAQVGRSAEAVEMFEQMQLRDGLRPNSITLVSLIPACLNSGDGECVHACVIKLGMDSDSLVATSLLDMYLKCGAVGVAEEIFHGLHDKNEITWFAMVAGLARNGHVGDAVSLVGRMLWDSKIILDSTALVNLISACADGRDLEHGIWLHTYVMKVGVRLDAFIGTALLNMYVKCGFLELAQHVFVEISDPSLVSWNAIMHPYARMGFLEDVMGQFWQLRQAGFSPDSVTLRNCLLALSKSSTYQRASKLGECFHGILIRYGFFDSEIATANSLLGFYAKIGDLKSAEAVFSCVNGRRDTISWNCLISGYVQNGSSKEAFLLFCQMQSAGMVPDSFTLSSILAACACSGEYSFGQGIHAYLMRRQGYTHHLLWDSFVGTALVDMYAKCGDVQSAYKVFKEIHVGQTATWNAMITGFGQNGYASEALDLFYNYVNDMGVSFSFESATATAISACSQFGCLEGGRSLHCFALRKGLESYIEVGNAILSMYSKCGMVQDAELYFKRMAQRDTASWTSMIAGYGINGRVRDAVSTFEEMIMKTMESDEEVKPNWITFVEVLWACSHGGLVKEGWGYFEKMGRVYGIKTEPEHCCCMVDLLGRAGYLYEAYVLIRSMKVKADAAVWGSLLNACRVYGELELGQIAWEELLRAQGTDSDHGVLLSNAYAEVGWWESVAGVRKKLSMAGWSKAPGWSQIKIREFMHVQ
ncbi:hypothetical protein AAC387_Pa11g1013 [Persea americana]